MRAREVRPGLMIFWGRFAGTLPTTAQPRAPMDPLSATHEISRITLLNASTVRTP